MLNKHSCHLNLGSKFNPTTIGSIHPSVCKPKVLLYIGSFISEVSVQRFFSNLDLEAVYVISVESIIRINRIQLFCNHLANSSAF